MRFQELDYLFEHNVVNIDAIQRYVGQFAAHCRNEVAREWFTKTLARHLEQDDELNKPLAKDQRPLNAPQWLDAAIERGDDVRVFHEPTHLNPIFDHLVDYFNYLADQNDPILSDRRRVLAVTVPVAIQKSEEWVQGDAKKALRQKVTGVEDIASYGNYTWVKPTSYEAVVRDGKILQNCLGQGTYGDEWKSGACRLFFLHDASGQPHVAIRTDRNLSIQEAKGKQNKPPIGRYVGLTAQFINDQKLKIGAAHDIKAMGLVVGEDGVVGTASSFGKVVYETNGLKVIETKAEFETVYNPRQYGGNGSAQVGGGTNFWFVSPKEGDLFPVNYDANKKIFISSLPENGIEYRSAVQDFLNNYFGDAPLPLASDHSSYGRKNALDQLKLPYDYLAHKYGTTEEVSKQAFIFGDFVAFMRGVGQNQYERLPRVSVEVKQNDKQAFSLQISQDRIMNVSWDFLYDEGKTGYFHANSEISAQEVKPYLPALIETMNKLALPPSNYLTPTSQNWRKELGIFYNCETKAYGPINKVGKKLWSAAGVTAYQWHEDASTEPQVSYFKGADIILSFKNSQENQKPYVDGKYTKIIQNVLLASLNDKVFDWTRTAELMLDQWDVFRDQSGRWTSREKAGEKFHTFDDGGYMTRIARGNDLITYTAYSGEDHPLISLDIRGGHAAVGVKVFESGKVAASRYFQWLLNSIGFSGEDTVDGGVANRYVNQELTAKMALWHMGLFHDTRSDSWKLIQDGKMIYDGGSWRAVNFRNRVFIVDNQKGLIGWFKKDGITISDEHVFPPYEYSELYEHLTELCRSTDFRMPDTKSYEKSYDEHMLNKNGYGFHPHTREFGKLTDHYPEKVVAQLPRGEQWIQRAFDNEFDDAKENLSHNRYSLLDKDGKAIMRVRCDDDHVQAIGYENKDGLYVNKGQDWGRMPDQTKKKLVILLEKAGLKLTPMQARDLGYYRTQDGTYKSIGSNKALAGYLSGTIKFADGHEFRFNHGTWELGIPNNAEGVEYWDRFRPYIKVKLDDDGIESVSYLKKEVKRKPKEYMPYIHKLMQIFSTIAGEEEE